MDAGELLDVKIGIDLSEQFDSLVLQYQDNIYNYVYRMVSDPLDAEDISQEVFVRAYQSLKNFRNECSFRTWIFRIATNLCVDHYRKKGRIPKNSVSLDQPISGDEREMHLDIPDFESNPQRIFESKDLRHEVQGAIQSLPEKLRTVVLLYDIEGFPYEEIAQILRCPLGTVKSRLFNARLKLKNKLQAYLNA